MDSLGYDPIFSVLGELQLPNLPTILNLTDTDYAAYNFDWIRSLAKVKQQLQLDVLFGFDVFPDPKDRDHNRLVLGTIETSSSLPL